MNNNSVKKSKRVETQHQGLTSWKAHPEVLSIVAGCYRVCSRVLAQAYNNRHHKNLSIWDFGRDGSMKCQHHQNGNSGSALEVRLTLLYLWHQSGYLRLHDFSKWPFKSNCRCMFKSSFNKVDIVLVILK